MSEELQFIPWSGEQIDLSTPQGALRGYLMATDFRHQVNDFQAYCRDALIAEADRLGQLKLQIGPQAVRIDGEGEEFTYDMAILAKLKEAGLPEFRWNEMVSWEPKVDQRVVNQVARTPAYREIIEAAVASRKPKRRQVRMGSR